MFEGTFIRNIPPRTAPAYYLTERHIFEEGESRVRFLHAGKDLKAVHLYTWLDCDAPESSIPRAIQEAKDRMEHYLVTPESSLEIIVEHRRHLVVKYRNGVPEEHTRDRHYEWDRDQSPVHGQERCTLVWSSKTPDVIHPSPPLSDAPAVGDTATPPAIQNKTHTANEPETRHHQIPPARP